MAGKETGSGALEGVSVYACPFLSKALSLKESSQSGPSAHFSPVPFL